MPCSYDYSNDCCESQPATSTTNSRTGTSLITELQQRHSSIRTSPELLRTEEMDDFLPDIDNDCKLAANSLTIPQSEYSTDHYILNTLLNSFVDAILSFTSVSRTTNVVDDLLFDDQKQPVYFNMRLFDCTDTLLESWLMTIDNNKM